MSSCMTSSSDTAEAAIVPPAPSVTVESTHDWIAGPGTPLHGCLAVPATSRSRIAPSCWRRSRTERRVSMDSSKAPTQGQPRLPSPPWASASNAGTCRADRARLGIDGLKAPQSPLDCWQRGDGDAAAGRTAGRAVIRLNIWLATRRCPERPMQRVIEPLHAMGARIDSDQGLPPLRITGGRSLKGNRLRPSGRQRTSEIGAAACRPVCRWRDENPRTEPDPRLHRTDAPGIWRRHRVRTRTCATARRSTPACD